ncbi:aminotransferase class V-fold PLP-dependent enzyme [Halomonadaceae bacterium KBTZ08]
MTERFSATQLQKEFPLDAGLAYLNHAAVAPWPQRASDAVARFATENSRLGAARYPQWLSVEERLRHNLARLINAPSAQDIALCKNTSEALSMVAAGLDWQEGDEVIITSQEFPSNRIVWESLVDQGVRVRVADIDRQDVTPEGAIEDLISDRTRLLSVSSVQYGTGLRLDAHHLGALCESHGILFCLDAIQSAGAEPLDVQATGAHFAMADGHKWLLGPEGLAFFYVAPQWRDRLTLYEFGWHMIADRGNFERKDWEPAPDARRFECGSPNMLAAHALEASTGLLLEVGLEQVRERIDQRINHLVSGLDQVAGLTPVTPRESQRRLGILTVQVPGHKSQHLCQKLAEQQVICASRGGDVRFSPHFYTPYAALEQALDALESLLRGA